MADPVTALDFVQASIDLITGFGLMPVVMATAIIGLGSFLLRKARSGAR